MEIFKVLDIGILIIIYVKIKLSKKTKIVFSTVFFPTKCFLNICIAKYFFMINK